MLILGVVEIQAEALASTFDLELTDCFVAGASMRDQCC